MNRRSIMAAVAAIVLAGRARDAAAQSVESVDTLAPVSIEAAPAPSGGLTVHSDDARRNAFSLLTPDGVVAAQCSRHCRMAVAPGQYRLTLDGAGRALTTDVVIEVGSEHAITYSAPSRAGGFSLLVLGGAMVVVGAVVLVLSGPSNYAGYDPAVAGLSAILACVGAAVALSGAAVVVADRRRLIHTRASAWLEPRIAVAPTQRGAMGAIAWAF